MNSTLQRIRAVCAATARLLSVLWQNKEEENAKLEHTVKHLEKTVESLKKM